MRQESDRITITRQLTTTGKHLVTVRREDPGVTHLRQRSLDSKPEAVAWGLMKARNLMLGREPSDDNEAA